MYWLGEHRFAAVAVMLQRALEGTLACECSSSVPAPWRGRSGAAALACASEVAQSPIADGRWQIGRRSFAQQELT